MNALMGCLSKLPPSLTGLNNCEITHRVTVLCIVHIRTRVRVKVHMCCYYTRTVGICFDKLEYLVTFITKSPGSHCQTNPETKLAVRQEDPHSTNSFCIQQASRKNIPEIFEFFSWVL
jgi:hypothetical protein